MLLVEIAAIKATHEVAESKLACSNRHDIRTAHHSVSKRRRTLCEVVRKQVSGTRHYRPILAAAIAA